MYCITRSPSLQRLERNAGKWIIFRLHLKEITLKDVAILIGMSASFVSDVLAGRRSSARVYNGICALLGYSDMNALLADARRSAA